MKKVLLIVLIMGTAFAVGAGGVRAALSWGSGVYVNLCGSGTIASSYTCDPGCDPNTGVCGGENRGIVRYTCTGKWNQCLESESGWSNREEIGNPGCGKTVQISKFDKKCRKEDGSWDETCNLLGYMVWYSGDCRLTGNASPAPTLRISTPSPTPRQLPSPTLRQVLTASPSAAPSPTAKSKLNVSTPTPTKKAASGSVCGKTCVLDSECGAGFVCAAGVCRNPACRTDSSCFCGQVKGEAVAEKSPKTGAETWMWGLGFAGAAGLGLGLIKLSKKIW